MYVVFAGWIFWNLLFLSNHFGGVVLQMSIARFGGSYAIVASES